MALTYQAAVEQTITAGEQIHQIVNGTATTEVTVEDGSKVPSVRKALLDNFYFKDPIAWQVGQTENVFNQLRQFTDGSWWYAPSATAINPVSMGSTPVGDVLWKIYDFDAIGKLTPQLREALRRSYAESGFNLVDGSFEVGGTVSAATDVLLYASQGKAYSWGGAVPKVVPPASSPATTGGVSPSGDWVDIGDVSLRYDLSSVTPGKGGSLVHGVSIQFDSLAQALAYPSLTAGRKVEVGGYNINSDGGQATFEVVNASDPLGILTDDGLFKLKRMSGHNYFNEIVSSGRLPRIAAHRGWGGITVGEYPGTGLSSPIYFVPENTRASIRFASERGAWAVEGDTKITSDGVPIVFHDTDMSRVTGGAHTGAVSSYTYAQIKAMDVGSYVSGAWAGERVMNYDEWLSECRKCRVVPFAEWSYPMSDAQANDFIALAVKYFGPKPTSVYVQSTNMDTLKLLRSKNAYIGLCVMGTYGTALSTEILDTAYRLGNCAAMLTGAAITNQSAVSDIKARGLSLVYAIANTQYRIDSAIYSGSDIIVTDFYKG